MNKLIPLFWCFFALASAAAIPLYALRQPETSLWPLFLVTLLFTAIFWRQYRKQHRLDQPEQSGTPKIVSLSSPCAHASLQRMARQLFDQHAQETAAAFERLAAQEHWNIAARTQYVDSLIAQALRHALCHTLFSARKEQLLEEFLRELHVPLERLSSTSRQLLRQGSLLYRLSSGSLVPRFKSEATPFTIMKQEKILWIFQNVPVYSLAAPEIAVPHAPDLLWQRSPKTPQTHEEAPEYSKWLYTGSIAITTRYLYIQLHPSHSLRLPLASLRELHVNDDSITLQRDNPRQPPLRCMLDMPYFFAQLLHHAPTWEQDSVPATTASNA